MTKLLPDEKTLPLTVANIGFLLDRMGRDCHDLQFLRELRNGLRIEISG